MRRHRERPGPLSTPRPEGCGARLASSCLLSRALLGHLLGTSAETTAVLAGASHRRRCGRAVARAQRYQPSSRTRRLSARCALPSARDADRPRFARKDVTRPSMLGLDGERARTATVRIDAGAGATLRSSNTASGWPSAASARRLLPRRRPALPLIEGDLVSPRRWYRLRAVSLLGEKSEAFELVGVLDSVASASQARAHRAPLSELALGTRFGATITASAAATGDLARRRPAGARGSGARHRPRGADG
jgi:hypothetical protein